MHDLNCRYGYHLRDLTIGNILAHQARANGEKLFITTISDGRTFTYRAVDELSSRLAQAFASLQLGPGSHVAVMMRNSAEQLLTYFALGKIGAVAVPLNVEARGTLLANYLSHSDSVALVVDDDLIDRFLEVGDFVPNIRDIIVYGAPDGGMAALPAASEIRWWSLCDLLEKSDARQDTVFVENKVKFSDPAYIMYTSGTTGPSKGVVFTQARALLSGISHCETNGFCGDDILYVCLPLYHLNALQGSTYTALVAGASIALAPKFSASRFWDHIRGHGVTSFNLLGSMGDILWNRPETPDDRRHAARTCVMTPAPPFAQAFEKRFGVRVLSGYGLSDFGAATSFTLADPVEKLGSAGRPRLGIELKIVDEDDFELPTGEIGEIILRSNNMWDTSSGYYKMPEATLASLRNNWFHTGDIGYLDNDGYLYFHSRAKDSIRRKGENISSYEVEQVILQHPHVMEVAAFPLRSDLSEDEVAAAIVLREENIVSEADIVEYCCAHMAPYMIPRFIRFAAALPKTGTLKVEKAALRAEAEADMSKFWDRQAATLRV